MFTGPRSFILLKDSLSSPPIYCFGPVLVLVFDSFKRLTGWLNYRMIAKVCFPYKSSQLISKLSWFGICLTLLRSLASAGWAHTVEALAGPWSAFTTSLLDDRGAVEVMVQILRWQVLRTKPAGITFYGNSFIIIHCQNIITPSLPTPNKTKANLLYSSHHFVSPRLLMLLKFS